MNVYHAPKNVYLATAEFVLHVSITIIQVQQEKAVSKIVRYLVLHVKIISQLYVNLVLVDQL